MTKVKSRRFAFAGVLAAMLMGLLGSLAPSAHAGAPAWLQTPSTTYLAAPGPEGGDPLIMVREIYLAEGLYYWDTYLTPQYGSPLMSSYANRDIWLATGTYWWACYLQPGNYYQITCSLNDGVHGNAYLQSSYFALPASGDYWFSSMLDS